MTILTLEDLDCEECLNETPNQPPSSPLPPPPPPPEFFDSNFMHLSSRDFRRQTYRLYEFSTSHAGHPLQQILHHTSSVLIFVLGWLRHHRIPGSELFIEMRDAAEELRSSIRLLQILMTSST